MNKTNKNLDPESLLGQKAPQFTLANAEQTPVSLSQFKGSWVVLYFYPKDNTPGCTIEALDFTALSAEFTKLNASIIGISKDSCASHQKFIEKKKLSINLLSDPQSEVQKLYHVWRLKKFMGREFLGTIRSTFLISPNQKIAHIWDNISAKNHAQDVLETLKKLAK